MVGLVRLSSIPFHLSDWTKRWKTINAILESFKIELLENWKSGFILILLCLCNSNKSFWLKINFNKELFVVMLQIWLMVVTFSFHLFKYVFCMKIWQCKEIEYVRNDSKNIPIFNVSIYFMIIYLPPSQQATRRTCSVNLKKIFKWTKRTQWIFWPH